MDSIVLAFGGVGDGASFKSDISRENLYILALLTSVNHSKERSNCGGGKKRLGQAGKTLDSMRKAPFLLVCPHRLEA